MIDVPSMLTADAPLADQEAACERADFDAFFAADDALHRQILTLAGHHGAWQVVQRSRLQLDRLRHSIRLIPRPSAS